MASTRDTQRFVGPPRVGGCASDQCPARGRRSLSINGRNVTTSGFPRSKTLPARPYPDHCQVVKAKVPRRKVTHGDVTFASRPPHLGTWSCTRKTSRIAANSQRQRKRTQSRSADPQSHPGLCHWFARSRCIMAKRHSSCRILYLYCFHVLFCFFSADAPFCSLHAAVGDRSVRLRDAWSRRDPTDTRRTDFFQLWNNPLAINGQRIEPESL